MITQRAQRLHLHHTSETEPLTVPTIARAYETSRCVASDAAHHCAIGCKGFKSSPVRAAGSRVTLHVGQSAVPWPANTAMREESRIVYYRQYRREISVEKSPLHAAAQFSKHAQR